MHRNAGPQEIELKRLFTMLYRGCFYRCAGGTRILYHIGPRAPQPVQKYWQYRWNGQHVPGYRREYLPENTGRVVFLTPDPMRVMWHHGMRGNIYRYEVPESVVAAAGGIHYYDGAPELIVPQELWPQCRLLGKVGADEAEDMLQQFEDSKEQHRWKRPVKPVTPEDRAKADQILQNQHRLQRQEKKWKRWKQRFPE
jgi:hypothetical protein